MPNYYCTDADLVDELPSDLTDTPFETSTQRDTKLRGPASRWVDSRYSETAFVDGFTDVGDASPPHAVISEAARAYALYLAFRRLRNNAEDETTKTWLEHAEALLKVDEQGNATFLPGGSATAIGLPLMVRK